MNLTAEQVERIGALLHEHIQFYDAQGSPANNIVIDEIESNLKAFPLSATICSRDGDLYPNAEKE